MTRDIGFRCHARACLWVYIANFREKNEKQYFDIGLEA